MNVVLWFLVVVIHGVFAQTENENATGNSVVTNSTLFQGNSTSSVDGRFEQTWSNTSTTVNDGLTNKESGIKNISARSNDSVSSTTTTQSIASDLSFEKNIETSTENLDQFSTTSLHQLINSHFSNAKSPEGETTPSFQSSDNSNKNLTEKNTVDAAETTDDGESKENSTGGTAKSSSENTVMGSLPENNTTGTISTSEDSFEVDCSSLPEIEFSNIEVSSFNVSLQWNVLNGSSNFTFKISLNNELIYNTSEFQYTIEDLNACTEYNVSICVYCDGIEGPKTTRNFITVVPEPFNYQVTNVTVDKTSDNKVGIWWEPPPQEVFSCVSSYYLVWWDDNNTDIPTENEVLNVSITSYELPFIGCAAYGIEVYPQVNSNNGNPVVQNFNVEPIPTSAPENISFTCDKTNASVTWKVDDKTKNRCTINEISITCEAPPEKNSNVSWIERNVTAKEEISEQSADFTYIVSIQNMSPFTNYTCTGFVTNDGGDSPTTLLEFQTNEDVPSEPASLNITDIGSNNFTIQWSEPEKIPGVMTAYGLTINNEGPQHLVEEECANNITASRYFEIGVENTSFVFEEALPHFKYTVLVYGIDGAGNGSKISKNAITASIEPDPVINPRKANPVYSNNETYYGAVNITFDPPCNTNGEFKYYNVTYKGVRNGFDDDFNVINTTMTTIEIRLLPDRDYEIGIRVVTEGFNSDPVSVSLHSKPGVPGPAANMTPPSSNDTNKAYFTLEKNVFDKSNGEVIAYALILCSNSQCKGNGYGFWDGTEESWPPKPNSTVQLTPNLWNPFKDLDGLASWDFIIGDNDKCPESSSYCNKQLDENKEYSLMVRALTGAAYRDSSLLRFKTEMSSGPLDLPLILGLTFGLLTVVILIVFLIILWRRKRKSKLPVEEKRYSESTPAPIPVQKFTNHYEGIKQNYTIIKQQFSDLAVKSKDVAGETSFALLPENRRKNRYANILPYDATRVTLKIDEDDEIGSDFINASYIKGYSGKIEYIATQGPLESTARDFWKMILQENVSIIVMVSQFIEQSKEKCYHYFPNNHESAYFGESLEVKCSTELHFGTYCIRTLQVRKGTEQRDIVHMQFLEWPDFGVPQGTDNMLQFCQQLREKVNKEGGLVVVHCSAGVGRTGTLIALDILLQAIRDHRDINIYKTVLDLRRQRTNMVQTEKQFMFIHTCIKDYLETPTIPTSDSRQERIYENVDVLKSSLKKNLIETELESAL